MTSESLAGLPPRLLIAATHSGAGKTTVAVGLAAAWRRQGRVVQVFKVGPDYIDPTHLAAAAGRPARNLDGWLVPPQRLVELFGRACRGAHVALVEGVMGLFDGLDPRRETASTAEVARLLRLPVVLVVDVRACTRSAAAVALGCVRLGADLHWAGFILNGAASPAHGAGVAAAVEEATGLPVFGWLPWDAGTSVAEGALGLVPADEGAGPGRGRVGAVARLARRVQAHLDLAGLWQAACRAPAARLAAGPQAGTDGPSRRPRGPRPVLAVARDAAFCFYYPENLELLEQAGARLRFFRPAEGEGLPPDARGVVLGGGFPELHAGRLAANEAFLHGLRRLWQQGSPIYAEGGGLMVLTRAIVTDEGRWPMVGLLPGEAVMGAGLRIGYREARAAGESWLLRPGETVRGHEFHRSRWRGRPRRLPAALAWEEGGGVREDGAAVGRLWASYVHLHFLSRPELAVRLVQACTAGGPPAPGGERR